MASTAGGVPAVGGVPAAGGAWAGSGANNDTRKQGPESDKNRRPDQARAPKGDMRTTMDLLGRTYSKD